MSNLDIKQQDAKALAAGYSKTFRVVEIVSILAFWALSFTIAWRLWPYALAYGWLLLAALAFGFILADFVGGLVHWLGDTWGSTEMPILGKALIRPFREHHVDEKAITRHDYIETNGANCMVAVPVAALLVFIPLDVEGWTAPALFTVASLGSMIFWVMMTNQIHKWSHLDEDQMPALLKLAQKLHLVLPPGHHQIHHTAPFDTYYCITTGWLNWPLAKIGFYRHLERLITALTGLIPRKDDIGLDAALKIAPLAPGKPKKATGEA
ncbi:MAG: fatty acid desaturase family protein [Myxococcota bacterium]